ncbi:MAG: hypothetical protein U5J97_10070 [Trueperaceae bacterium]|nr:hypothetical protein [Trueperaceae bacterium]
MPIVASRLRFLAMIMALFVGLGVAQAQDARSQEGTVIGTIEATLNGEAGTWYVLEFATAEGPQATASWSSIMGVMLNLSLQSHPQRRYALEKTLSLEFSLYSPPSDCPCSYGSEQVSAMYWPESSMLQNVHVSDAGGSAEGTITTFEEISEGVYRLEGTFSAEMPLLPQMNAEPDMSQVATIEGSFVVERLPELDIEMP